MKIKYLVVHHNGVPGRTIEDIRRTHVKERGWRDVGYHYVYHEDGSEHVGRPETMRGAHVEGLNEESLGLCCIGNGNKQDFNEAQYKALVARLVDLCERYPGVRIVGHRETKLLVDHELMTKKNCPGRYVNLDKLRARVAQILDPQEPLDTLNRKACRIA